MLATSQMTETKFLTVHRRLITNSSDRILRQFNLQNYPQSVEGQIMTTEIEPALRFSDPINKVAWHNMAYSHDGDLLAGG